MSWPIKPRPITQVVSPRGYLSAPYALHGDSPNRRERCVLWRRRRLPEPERTDSSAPGCLSMEGELVAGRSNHLTYGELLGARADLDDDAAQRVAERSVTVQSVHRLLVRRQRALLSHRIQKLANLVRSGTGLASPMTFALR